MGHYLKNDQVMLVEQLTNMHRLAGGTGGLRSRLLCPLLVKLFSGKFKITS